MRRLNVGVLFAVGVPLGLLCGVLHFAFWLRWRERALLWWAAADGIGTLGVLLMLARDALPGWLARSVGESLLFASGLLLWLGFRRFAGQALPLRAFAAASLFYLAAFQALLSGFPDLAALIVLASFAHGLVNAGIAFDLARAQLAEAPRLRAVLAAVFALHALFYLFRSVTAVTVEANAEFLNAAGLQSATLLFGLVNVLLWNAVALWMAGERRRGSGAGAPAAA